MHPPRSNSAFQASQFGDQNGGSAQTPQGQQAARPAGADQTAANQIEGREEQPVWQSAFVLGPNVRFTRTPDRMPAKPETVEPLTASTAAATPTTSAPQAASVPAYQPQTAITPAHAARVTAQADQRPAAPYGLPRTGAPTQAATSARHPVSTQALQQQQQPRMPASVTLPQPPDAVGARALTYKLRRELARQQAEQAAWEASMADGGTGDIGPAPQPMQPAPLVEGMRSVLASTQAASVGTAAGRITAEANVPPHLQRSLAQQAETARLAAQQTAPAIRPPMVRNAFLRTPPAQGGVQPAAAPQTATQGGAPVAQSASPTTSGFVAWAQMTTPSAATVEAPAAIIPPAADAPAQNTRLPIAALLSDHIFFEALIDQTDAPAEIEMARPTPSNPMVASPKPMAVQPKQQVAPAPAPSTPARIPQAPAAIRAEVVRYRPEGLSTQVSTGSIRKPAFEATPGSVVALYREVARRQISASTLDGASPQHAVTEKPPEAAVRTPVQAPHPASVSISAAQPRQPLFRAQDALGEGEYELPYLDYLQMPPVQTGVTMTAEALEQSAGLLESVLEDFGIKGEVIDVRPGPVVTLYEFEPAPGVKSSRVIGLSDDIARSMSALSARVAVVPGRNVIGIELPNPVRETVYLRELIETPDYAETRYKLPVCLGKTIGGEPVIAELAKMPHLLVAGTTGSGKSVAINTMILSLLYRFRPDECRLIMVDPKMLELSVYDGIPHLLTPVVTDPKKAVMALKWAVREMEDRYRKMSRLGVRNIDGYNARAAQAREKGETITVSVQTGFDRQSGEIVYEEQELDLSPMPYIVVVVDEMADLMMVAGKEIEGAIQRLAQMARAAGIHLIMATQRPSVDVITGTIKANFPTRVSFQVTSKIDSRTILGEPGAEHLLGQGDMLHMVGGGRIARVHGPFVSDEEVEKVVAHLKLQGRPEYLGTVTEDADEVEEEPEEDTAVFDKGAMAEEDGNDLYDKAVKVVLRDKKCSTSYIQRRLSIGYNKAASLVERMEQEGIVGAANHVGKRAIIVGGREVSGEGDFEG